MEQFSVYPFPVVSLSGLIQKPGVVAFDACQIVVMAVVWCYCVVEYYVVPALTIPYYYIRVRQQRLALVT